MKKIILTCLLGGLCLFGSNLKARTKVVDSPGKGGTREFPASPDSLTSALIYGELINPDSLGPVKLIFTPIKLTERYSLGKEELIAATEAGTFFDGVLDPRVRKFKVQLPKTSGYSYLSLQIGDRIILNDFLVSSSDSLMIGIDFSSLQVSFSGPKSNWFEAQYEIQRSIN
jgi:hypothetical protein